MKKSFVLLIFLAFGCLSLSAQSTNNLMEKNRAFTGAKAVAKHYKAIFQLDSKDPVIIEKTFRNMKNALNDPRLKGKIEIELVTFSGGTEVCLKGSKYEENLKDLVNKGVIVAQCANSLKERKIDRNELYDFIGLVPSGTGELILRQAEGWSVVKP
jgi:hypothetical protein